MAQQLPLNLTLRPSDPRDTLVCGPANAEARAALADPRRWRGGALALVGPCGSGKSHLARAWAAEQGALLVSAMDAAVHQSATCDLAQTILDAVHAGQALVMDAADGLAPRALYQLLNAARRDAAAAVLLTSRREPREWPAAAEIPDVASRLQALPVAFLQPPSDEEFVDVLRTVFQRRGVLVEDTFISYVHARIERSYGAAAALADALDARALAARRPVTRALAQAYFSEVEQTHG